MPIAADEEDHRYRHLNSTSESVPLRPSLEHAYRSDSDSEDDFADINTTPPVNHEYRNGRRWPWTAKFRRIISGEGSEKEYKGTARRRSPQPGGSKGIRGFCWRRKYCLLILGILLAGVLVILSGGAFWVFKTAPKDGVWLLATLVVARADNT